MMDDHYTPAPKPTARSVQGLLIVAVIVSLLLGLAAGFVGGQLATGGLRNPFRSTTVATANGSLTTLNVQEESSTVDVVKNAQPSVVSIVITKDLSKYFNQSDAFGFPFNFFFGNGQGQQQQGQQQVGSGSGFIVSADGYVMTNRHVVEDTQAEYTVVTNDGKQYAAKVIGTDPVNDIAVLKIDAKNLPALTWGNSDNLAIGQTVIAIGNALGQYTNTVTKGVVSGLAREVTAGDGSSSETLENVIQTDAAINPGNSGGPLLNLDGQVVGMNTAVSQQGQLIGFAIPSNDVQHVFESVQKNGKIVRPYLGVRYTPITKALQQQNKLTVDYGVLVQRGSQATDVAVIPGSPADKAGIVENDIILEMNGVKLDSTHSLAGQIQKRSVGDKVTLKLLSKGKEKTVTATLEEYK